MQEHWHHWHFIWLTLQLRTRTDVTN